MQARVAAAIVLVLICSTTLAAMGKREQADGSRDYACGLAAGQRDARDVGVGVLSGLRIDKSLLILPWVMGKEVPGGDLIGKSAEFVGGYVDEYAGRAKPRNLPYSLQQLSISAWSPTGEDCVDCGCEVGSCVFEAADDCGPTIDSLSAAGCIK